MLHASAIRLEAVARGHKARADFLRQKAAATKLESAFRGMHARHEVEKKKKEESRRRRASILKRKERKKKQKPSTKGITQHGEQQQAKSKPHRPKQKDMDANQEGMLKRLLAAQKARVKGIIKRR